MGLEAIIGIVGGVLGIAGVGSGLLITLKNNGKWVGIVEHKMDTMIDNLGKLERRMEKLEERHATAGEKITAMDKELDALKRSVERLHSRVDRLAGGRDPGL